MKMAVIILCAYDERHLCINMEKKKLHLNLIHLFHNFYNFSYVINDIIMNLKDNNIYLET